MSHECLVARDLTSDGGLCPPTQALWRKSELPHPWGLVGSERVDLGTKAAPMEHVPCCPRDLRSSCTGITSLRLWEVSAAVTPALVQQLGGAEGLQGHVTLSRPPSW